MKHVITVDGPTSSGKNSVCVLFAKKIGYEFIDSGWIYRVGTLRAIEKKIAPHEVPKLVEVFKNLSLEFKTEGEKQDILDQGENVTDAIYMPEISRLTPFIAEHKDVRVVVEKIQRDLAEKYNMVMAGRDIGSEVFPQVQLKFYLTASVEVRADRRYKQLKEKVPNITFKEVLEDLKKRDEMDMTRAVSPLKIPEDANVIDTTHLTVEQTVNKMLDYFEQVFHEVIPLKV